MNEAIKLAKDVGAVETVDGGIMMMGFELEAFYDEAVKRGRFEIHKEIGDQLQKVREMSQVDGVTWLVK